MVILNNFIPSPLRCRTSGFGLPGMKPCCQENETIVGFAVTGTIKAQHPATEEYNDERDKLYKAASENPYPTIICIQDTDYPHIGLFGREMQASIFKSLGVVGTITEGGVET